MNTGSQKWPYNGESMTKRKGRQFPRDKVYSFNFSGQFPRGKKAAKPDTKEGISAEISRCTFLFNFDFPQENSQEGSVRMRTSETGRNLPKNPKTPKTPKSQHQGRKKGAKYKGRKGEQF